MHNSIFLFTDIVGSTRLWEQMPAAMSAAVALHDVLLRNIVQSHGGTVVKMSGDGIHAVFGDAGRALAAAAEIQCRLRDETKHVLALAIRCGLHAGAAEARDGDYYGATVNRAARLCDAANGGQIIFSEAVFQLTSRHLAEPLGARGLGTLRLRDLSEAETVYQLLHPDLPQDFPPLRGLAANPNNLPFLLNSFVGRYSEISTIRMLFTQSRLVSLLGTGGIGKTRLALQASANMLDRFPDGVWVIALASITDESGIAAHIMRTLVLRPQGSLPIEAQLVEHLRDKKTLLVLDNCEHLIDGVAHFCANLAQQAPYTHILATSREALEIAGEAVFWVPVLPLPDVDFSVGANLSAAGSLESIPSVRLFLDRTALVCPGFSLADGEAPTLARICYRLDGIPLAIELAAARMRTMTLAELDRGMDDRFGLLVTGSRVAAPRQKTLQATLEWSYALLTDAERTLLERLAVFAGGGELAAVAGICGLDDKQAADLVRALADKSLVQLSDVGGVARFGMLETLRQFARQKLEEHQQQSPLPMQHAQWYRNHILALAPQLHSSDRVRLLARLDADQANLRLALQYFIAVEPLVAIECTIAIGRYWLWRGQYAEGRDIMESALAAQLRIGEIPPELEAKLRYFSGGYCYSMCELPAAAEHYQLAVNAGRMANDDAVLGAVTCGLAMVAYVQRGYTASKALYEEGIALLLRGGETRTAAINVANLADTAAYANEIDHAERCLTQLEELSAKLAEPMIEARLLSSRGQNCLNQGQYEEAVTWFQRNLELGLQMSDQTSVGLGRYYLAAALTGLGDLNAAANEFTPAINMLNRSNARIELCNALESFAFWCSKNGDDHSAVLICGATQSVREKIGFPVGAQAREARRRALAAVEKTLADNQRERARAKGARMSLNEVVTLALQLAAAGRPAERMAESA